MSGSDRVFPIAVSTPATLCGRATLWRHRGGLRATVIVKATFGMVPDAPAVPEPPLELFGADMPFSKKPNASIRAASDLAPFRPRADVTLVGHACAPPGRPAPAMSARLGLFRGGSLLDKTLHVFGKRAGATPANVEPFEKMPIRYERAYGGWLSKENPVGVGAEPAPAELPNIIDPSDPRRPAGFGPISCFWWDRLRLLGELNRSVLEAPIGEIPDDFAWEYFQAAPADQRVSFLQGDEWIVLDGMHPSLPRVRTQLPSARAAARAYFWGAAGPGQPHEVELVADTLAIDTDELRFAVVWRGNLALPGEQSLGALRFVAGLGVLGAPVVWPDPSQIVWAAAPSSPGVNAVDEGRVAQTAVLSESEPPHGAATPFSVPGAGASTVHLSEEEQDASAQRSVAPFPTAAPGASEPSRAPSLPGAPWSPAAEIVLPPRPLMGQGTLMVAEEVAPPRELPVAPPVVNISAAPVAAPPPAAARPPVAAPAPAPIRPVPARSRSPERPRRAPAGPRAPEAVAASLRGAGLGADDIAALLAALNPPPPPPPDEDDD